MRRAATELPANEGAGRTGGTGWLPGAAHPDAQPRREGGKSTAPSSLLLSDSFRRNGWRYHEFGKGQGWGMNLITSGWSQTLLLVLRWPLVIRMLPLGPFKCPESDDVGGGHALTLFGDPFILFDC